MTTRDAGTAPPAHPQILSGAPVVAMACLAAGCGEPPAEPNGPADSARGSRAATCCPIVELRQYTLHPGQRDVLIELFDREFIETQEATGMTVIGQFRDLGDANRFVWFRGFRDMSSRSTALQAFYGGPVWKAHRAAANATMIDSDNVLLLHPARPGSGFALAARTRSPRGASAERGDIVTATVAPIAPADVGLVDFVEREVVPVLAETGAPVEATFVTDSSPNTFPALPVREGEHVLVWLSRFPDRTAHDRHVAALAASPRWREVSRTLQHRLTAPPQSLVLSPTPRSLW